MKLDGNINMKQSKDDQDLDPEYIAQPILQTSQDQKKQTKNPSSKVMTSMGGNQQVSSCCSTLKDDTGLRKPNRRTKKQDVFGATWHGTSTTTKSKNINTTKNSTTSSRKPNSLIVKELESLINMATAAGNNTTDPSKESKSGRKKNLDQLRSSHHRRGSKERHRRLEEPETKKSSSVHEPRRREMNKSKISRSIGHQKQTSDEDPIRITETAVSRPMEDNLRSSRHGASSKSQVTTSDPKQHDSLRSCRHRGSSGSRRRSMDTSTSHESPSSSDNRKRATSRSSGRTKNDSSMNANITTTKSPGAPRRSNSWSEMRRRQTKKEIDPLKSSRHGSSRRTQTEDETGDGMTQSRRTGGVPTRDRSSSRGRRRCHYRHDQKDSQGEDSFASKASSSTPETGTERRSHSTSRAPRTRSSSNGRGRRQRSEQQQEDRVEEGVRPRKSRSASGERRMRKGTTVADKEKSGVDTTKRRHLKGTRLAAATDGGRTGSGNFVTAEDTAAFLDFSTISFENAWGDEFGVHPKSMRPTVDPERAKVAAKALEKG